MSLDGLRPRQLLAALVHDAGLTFAVDPGAATTLDAVRSLIATAGRTDTPEERLLSAVRAGLGVPRRTSPPPITDVGDDSFEIESSTGMGSTAVRIIVRVSSAGLVALECRVPLGLPREGALRLANERNALSPDDANLDLENAVRTFVEDDEVRLTIITTPAAIESGAWTFETKELEDAVRSLPIDA